MVQFYLLEVLRTSQTSPDLALVLLQSCLVISSSIICAPKPGSVAVLECWSRGEAAEVGRFTLYDASSFLGLTVINTKSTLRLRALAVSEAVANVPF